MKDDPVAQPGPAGSTGYDFVDAAGKPVELPADGVVPPSMAPPDLPIRMLEMPEHPYGGLGRR